MTLERLVLVRFLNKQIRTERRARQIKTKHAQKLFENRSECQRRLLFMTWSFFFFSFFLSTKQPDKVLSVLESIINMMNKSSSFVTQTEHSVWGFGLSNTWWNNAKETCTAPINFSIWLSRVEGFLCTSPEFLYVRASQFILSLAAYLVNWPTDLPAATFLCWSLFLLLGFLYTYEA